MITRQEALRLGAEAIRANGLGSGARSALLVDELTSRPPLLYNDPDLSEVWIVYAERPVTGLRSSAIVLLSRATGAVLYAGSANDEG